MHALSTSKFRLNKVTIDAMGCQKHISETIIEKNLWRQITVGFSQSLIVSGIGFYFFPRVSGHLSVLKTREKGVVNMDIGPFRAKETIWPVITL